MKTWPGDAPGPVTFGRLASSASRSASQRVDVGIELA